MKNAIKLMITLTLEAPAVTYLVAVAAAYWVAVAPMAPAAEVAMLPVTMALTPPVGGGATTVHPQLVTVIGWLAVVAV